MSHLSDLDLIDAIRKNDESAFAELYDRYWGYVYTITYKRVQSKDLAKKIVQDLFVSIWTKRKSLAVYHMPSYLYVCVKHSVLNHSSARNLNKQLWEDHESLVPMHVEEVHEKVEPDPLLSTAEIETETVLGKRKQLADVDFFNRTSVQELTDTFDISGKSFSYQFGLSLKKLVVHLKNIAFSILFFTH